MYEKVNPSHPDKVADRIAGALVDLAYSKQDRPRIAVEVLIGHGQCDIIAESSVFILPDAVQKIVNRIAGNSIKHVSFTYVPQDKHLAENQKDVIRCGDNGIFRGVRTTIEQRVLSGIARQIYEQYPTDGKYIMTDKRLIICQSHVRTQDLQEQYPTATVNPLGDWTGGTDVDTGATNRKLGSDMGDAVTGGGLHGKDLSKADVSVNIYAHLKAQKTKKKVEITCAIGDEEVDGKPYSEIVAIAEKYIKQIGGFEKFAEWGLI